MTVTRYQQIAQHLVGKVTSGELPVGALLPTELQLMDEYGASRNTIRAALKEMQEMGLVSRRRNRGTMVEALPAVGSFTQSLATLDDLVSLAQTAQRKIEETGHVVLDVATARELGCPPGSRWIHIGLTRREEGAALPLGWTDAFVDTHYEGLPKLAAKYPGKLFCDLIEETYGRRIGTVEQTVSACAVEGEIARRLRAEDGSTGLKVLRKYRDPASAVVLVTRSVYPRGRYSLTTTMVRSR
ncbi:GntR family transcriptional regulator [Caenimonas soli]|uniref:GntR family transcriptional regulator n=1 Tax=Caenimonas soli TaxID=2735555 RepID=UPI0015557D6C|nr:GntR family transcriptional regulator [Caenimonas soli]NPC54611.1 GntR family transcriptional regulator [Caenimonas soli]